LLNYSEFLHTFGIPREFAVVMDAIPSGILALLKGTGKPDCLLWTLSWSQLVIYVSQPQRGTVIFALYSREMSPAHLMLSPIGLILLTTWINNKYLLTNKVREISFKIIHRYYPAKQYLLRFKLVMCVNSSLCGVCPETMVHLFWQCPYTITVWKDLSRFITVRLIADFSLFWRDVLFGLHVNKGKKKRTKYI